MKTVRLSIVTEKQNNISKADKLAKLIAETLEIGNPFHVEKYQKFDNSYKIDFTLNFENPDNSIPESIEKTDRLCSPWTVLLNRNENEIELTFNKTSHTTYTKNDFNIIVWGYWQVEK